MHVHCAQSVLPGFAVLTSFAVVTGTFSTAPDAKASCGWMIPASRALKAASVSLGSTSRKGTATALELPIHPVWPVRHPVAVPPGTFSQGVTEQLRHQMHPVSCVVFACLGSILSGCATDLAWWTLSARHVEPPVLKASMSTSRTALAQRK